jgi:integrase
VSADRPARPELEVSYNVRVFSVRKKDRQRGPVYEVRWRVAGRSKARTFTTKAMADSFRAALVVATRAGEPFDVASGRPMSMLPALVPAAWWDWMLAFVDLKWPTLAPSSRLSIATSLATITMAMLKTTGSGPSMQQINTTVQQWAANAARRAAGPVPERMVDTVKWLERNTVMLSELNDPQRARAVLDAISRCQDGSPAAATTIARRRAVLYNAMELAVERRLLTTNPLERIRWKAPKVADALYPRSVISPPQARALLEAVAAQPGGRRYVAFFGCMYYSALRPSEASALLLEDLQLPESEDEWGEIWVSRSNPQISAAWTDEGRRVARQLKHRARGEVRRVPCPPQLGVLLRAHLAEFCQDGSPRLFRGPMGADLQAGTYARVWRAARAAALTRREVAGGLARRPYDLRHAAVSTWLAAGVDSTQVAAWAGHSVLVLHRVYAHVVEGRRTDAERRIAAALEP